MSVLKRINMLISAAIWIFLTVPGQAGSKTGADFLKLPIGAHAVGMGQATSAGLVGVDALNWNPAATNLAPSPIQFRKMGLAFSHQQLFTDNTLDQLGFTMPLSRLTVGVNVLRVSYAEQEERLADRSLSGHFAPSDTAAGLSLATSLGGLQVGSQVKWISQKLASEEAQAMALDLGVLSPTPFSKLTVGASMRNLGQKMQFISESYNLPLTLSAGGVYQVLSPLALSFDVVNRPYQHQTSLAFGAELNTTSFISLRAGYLAKLAETISNSQSNDHSQGNFGGIDGISAGLGVKLNQFQLDYAFAPYGELGSHQIITLSAYFSGRTAEKPTTTKPVEEAPKQDRQIIIFDGQSDNKLVPSEPTTNEKP